MIRQKHEILEQDSPNQIDVMRGQNAGCKSGMKSSRIMWLSC